MTVINKSMGTPAVGRSIDDSPSISADLPSGEAVSELVCFVIDDDLAIQRLIAGQLSAAGAKAETYKSAEAALKGLRKIRPHLVFLDGSLEGSDAVEVMRGLSAAGFRGKVQLVSGQDEQTLHGLELVGTRHGLAMLPPLRKPFRISAIRDLIKNNISELMREAPPKFAEVKSNYQKVRLEEALQNNWIQLWYQPKINLQQMTPCGVEGLARCVHPVMGLVMPGMFLPNADEASMLKLAQRQLIAALRDWPAFAAAGFASFKMSVNMSVATLFKLPIAQIAREYSPKDSRWPGMTIEITEDQAINDIHLIHEIAIQLKLYKLSIAIDDFGAGYAQFARLKEFPFSELKLDRSLVSKCDEDPQVASLARTAIELAHRFGTTAVAEGIEKASEAKVLRSMGCDEGQGFLFAPAVQRDKLIAAMRKRLAGTAPVGV